MLGAMNRLFACLMMVWGLSAVAQVRVEIGLPVIRFEVAPPLVVVAPGVQVVEDYDDEVFFVDGWYWVRRDQHWYRAHDHHGQWVVVEHHHVPASIVRLPPGQYKKFHGKHGDAPGGPSGKGKEKGKHGKGKGHGKH